MQLFIRPAVPDDTAAVAAIHVRSWQVGYRGLLPDDYLDGLRPEDRAGRYTFGDRVPGGPTTIVALGKGLLRGFATTGPSRGADSSGRGELMALYVDPDCWGSGVGRGLLERARADLVRLGRSEAEVWVLVGNERAQRFYGRDGWVPDGSQRKTNSWDITFDTLRCLRPLP